MIKILTQTICVVCVAAWSSHAVEAEDLLNSVEKGELILEGPMPLEGQKSKFAHGITEILEGGGVTGRTDPKFDGHGAGMGVKMVHGNAIYQFELKIEGDIVGGFHVGSHGLSFKFTPSQVWIGDAKTPDAEKTPISLAGDQWYTVTVSRVGTQGSIQIGDVIVKGEYEGLGPEVEALRFHIKGDPKASVSFRNLKIWEAVSAK